MTSIKFTDLGLDAEILRAIEREGYDTPTDVQAKAIPAAMAGNDVLALAPTGTGKTAAFTLPLLHRLLSNPVDGPRQIRALIITPTRELALQVNEALHAYGRFLKIRTAVVLGGVGMGTQIQAVKRKPEILVATPGRLEDLIQQGYIDLRDIETFILDEADRMLDMGFIPAVRRLERQMPEKRQTLLFSATMPREIENLAASLLRDPTRVEVERKEEERGNIVQRLIYVDRNDKQDLLESLIKTEDVYLGLVFSRTKFRADAVARKLNKAGIRADAIHGNKSQNARQRALKSFTQGRLQVLVATDIAARGIDVDNISHVFNMDLCDDPESHVHRIGRTGRAGKEGIAISFCDATEPEKLAAIERMMGYEIPTDDSHELADPGIERLKPTGRGGRGGGGRNKSRNARPQRQRDDRGPRNFGGGSDRDERPARGDRNERPARSDRNERPTRGERDERPARDDRPVRSERPARPVRAKAKGFGDDRRSDEGEARSQGGKPSKQRKSNGNRSNAEAAPAKSKSAPRRGDKPGAKPGKASSKNPLEQRRARRDGEGGERSEGGSGNTMRPRRRGEKLMDRKASGGGDSQQGGSGQKRRGPARPAGQVGAKRKGPAQRGGARPARSGAAR